MLRLAGTSFRPTLGAPVYPAVDDISSNDAINATTQKVGLCGSVWFPARTGSKTISTIGFRFRTVVKSGGSGLTVSLQDVTYATDGTPKPDETQDQTVAIANGDTGFASNVWYQTAALSATRTVAFGEALAVVFEWDGGGRLAPDSLQIAGLPPSNSANWPLMTRKNAGVWTSSVLPNLILYFSDGTVGTFAGAFPFSATGSLTYNSGSATDEYALECSFPGPVRIDGVSGLWFPNTGGDLDVICYDGTTPMTNGSVSIPAAYRNQTSSSHFDHCFAAFPGEVRLCANTTYRIAVKPTTTNNVSLRYFDVSAANHFTAHVGGSTWALTGRVNGGAWDAITATRRPFLWPHVSALN